MHESAARRYEQIYERTPPKMYHVDLLHIGTGGFLTMVSLGSEDIGWHVVSGMPTDYEYRNDIAPAAEM